MKYIVLISFIFVNTFLFSQNYEAKYADFSFGLKSSGTLIFNSSEWKYTKSAELVITSKKTIGVSVDEMNETKESAGYDSAFCFYSLKDNNYLWEKSLAANEKCIVKGDLVRPDWEIVSDSTKKIGDYLCTMAQGDLCGWKIKAWYSPDIQVSCGPWRIWGLPGLIMNVSSEDGDIDIQLISIQEAKEAPQMPLVKKTFSVEEYKDLRKKSQEKLERTLNALPSDRNTTVSFRVEARTYDKCLQ